MEPVSLLDVISVWEEQRSSSVVVDNVHLHLPTWLYGILAPTRQVFLPSDTAFMSAAVSSVVCCHGDLRSGSHRI